MPEVTFDQVAEDVRALTSEEQRRLRDLLDGWIGCARMSEEEKQAELDRRLMAKGLLQRVPPQIADLTPYRDWEPIDIQGEPLSETIIRERE